VTYIKTAKITIITSWAVEIIRIRIISAALEVIKLICVVLYVSLNDGPYGSYASLRPSHFHSRLYSHTAALCWCTHQLKGTPRISRTPPDTARAWHRQNLKHTKLYVNHCQYWRWSKSASQTVSLFMWQIEIWILTMLKDSKRASHTHDLWPHHGAQKPTLAYKYRTLSYRRDSARCGCRSPQLKSMIQAKSIAQLRPLNSTILTKFTCSILIGYY